MSASLNSILQWIGVSVAVLLAVLYVIKCLKGDRSSCRSCELSETCIKRKNKKGKSQ